MTEGKHSNFCTIVISTTTHEPRIYWKDKPEITIKSQTFLMLFIIYYFLNNALIIVYIAKTVKDVRRTMTVTKGKHSRAWTIMETRTTDVPRDLSPDKLQIPIKSLITIIFHYVKCLNFYLIYFLFYVFILFEMEFYF